MIAPASHPPDARALRRFGLLMGAMLAGLFGVLVPLVKGRPEPVWPWVAAAPFVLAALALPRALTPVHRAWMRLGHALGWVNTRILLTLVFFLIVTPMGLAMRALGRDPLARGRGAGADSHRRPSEAPPRERMERPY